MQSMIIFQENWIEILTHLSEKSQYIWMNMQEAITVFLKNVESLCLGHLKKKTQQHNHNKNNNNWQNTARRISVFTYYSCWKLWWDSIQICFQLQITFTISLSRQPGTIPLSHNFLELCPTTLNLDVKLINNGI